MLIDLLLDASHVNEGRKKKCDEQKPHCLRCTKGGFECEGYPTFEVRMRRITFGLPTNTGPGQSTSCTELLQASTVAVFSPKEPELATSSGLSEDSQALIRDSKSNNQILLVDCNPSALKHNRIVHEHSSRLDSCLDDSRNACNGVVSLHLNQPPLISSSSSASILLSSSSSPRNSSITSISTNTEPSITLTAGQASLLSSLFSLAHSDDYVPKLIESGSSQFIGPLYGPSWPFVLWDEEEGSAADNGDDPEGIRAIICRSPTPDPNTQSNALPFVLQSYAHWVNFVAFEPLKVAGMIREGVIMQFTSSPEVRTRVCLTANVISRLSKNPELCPRGTSIVLMLRSQAHQHIKDFRSKGFASERSIDMQSAHRALDSMMEMILIQRYSSPLSNLVALMEAAAPVFRRACPEPPERLVNLPNILASPGLNLQHFSATDVIIAAATSRPMFFKYDVTCTPETYAQLVKGDYGLQWLHGVPDYFIVLLAWINILHEDYGNGVDQKYVAEIERQVRSVKIKSGFTPDPSFLVLRFAVQECWRQTVYVYLYMALCGAQADDPRVARAVRSFVHIVNGIKTGRNPDSFLFIPIMVVGGFAYRERDRSILRQRMEGLRECANPSAASYDCLEVMKDIWLRTRAENRPAVWSDIRVSYSKITGV
ncbi:unnamed protein product [Rhizoctonia solani]|uniref:Zn(2)-C6 fungal-type domain-containing protein n=1 Tax=Rhizoctonia solani TaxID=456999 RepID=A0A8H3B3K7_9AGAM|nr:unnamed protein product [Rhizoctonia solani]